MGAVHHEYYHFTVTATDRRCTPGVLLPHCDCYRRVLYIRSTTTSLWLLQMCVVHQEYYRYCLTVTATDRCCTPGVLLPHCDCYRWVLYTRSITTSLWLLQTGAVHQEYYHIVFIFQTGAVHQEYYRIVLILQTGAEHQAVNPLRLNVITFGQM